MLNDNTRGPTMEAVVSRMKTINSVCKMERSGMDPSQLGMRFIAVSATIPNASDVSMKKCYVLRLIDVESGRIY